MARCLLGRNVARAAECLIESFRERPFPEDSRIVSRLAFLRKCYEIAALGSGTGYLHSVGKVGRNLSHYFGQALATDFTIRGLVRKRISVLGCSGL